LRSQIQSGLMSRLEEDVLRLVRGIANGLAYLHDQSILHCDLKSDNILLSSTDEPLIADFGLSRIIGGDYSIAISHSGASPGTIRWSAPELFDDDTHFTKETDVWAFGMVIYEIITHHVPYFEQVLEPQVLNKILSGELPGWPDHSERKVFQAGPESHWRELCSKCCRKHPEDRVTVSSLLLFLGDMFIDGISWGLGPMTDSENVLIDGISSGSHSLTENVSIHYEPIKVDSLANRASRIGSASRRATVRSKHGSGHLSDYQRGAMNRNYNRCDQCRKDRKKCEGGVPCLRCVRMKKTCTSRGVSQLDNINTLVAQTGGPGCLFGTYTNRDGYYAIYSPGDGFSYVQSLSNFCESVGLPQRICPDYQLDVGITPYHVDFTVDDLVNAGCNWA